MNLENKIEGILFMKGEPVSIKKLEQILNVSNVEIADALSNLENSLANRGIVLMRKENQITLGTHPELSVLLEEIKKEELNKNLSKASLETLAIILYKNGAPRSLIDYIRGVNSNFILRALLVRGLIEKVTDPNDSRRNIYKPTFELLSYMGVSRVEDLPGYSETIASISQAEQSEKELERANGEEVSE